MRPFFFYQSMCSIAQSDRLFGNNTIMIWGGDVVVAGDSDTSWNTSIFFNRRFGENKALNLGYRYLVDDYDNVGVYGWDVTQCGPVVGFSQQQTYIEDSENYYFSSTLNFCPPTVASYIRPPLACVNIATPALKLASADAPAFIATAEACAPSS